MKLLTHNLLSSKCVKGVTIGFPLKITAKDITVTKVHFNSDFIARMIPKLDWSAFVQAAECVGKHGELPPQVADGYENNEEFLRKVHHILFEIDVISGDLECPETGRKFPINKGIPNMLVNEDEV